MGYSIYIAAKTKEGQENIYRILDSIPMFGEVFYGRKTGGYALAMGEDLVYKDEMVIYPVGYNFNCSMQERAYMMHMIGGVAEIYKSSTYYDSEPHYIKPLNTQFMEYMEMLKERYEDMTALDIFNQAIRAFEICPLSIEILTELGFPLTEEVLKAIGYYQAFEAIFQKYVMK